MVGILSIPCLNKEFIQWFCFNDYLFKVLSWLVIDIAERKKYILTKFVLVKWGFCTKHGNITQFCLLLPPLWWMVMLANRGITEEEEPCISTTQRCIKASKLTALLGVEARRKSWSLWGRKGIPGYKKKQSSWGFTVRIMTMGFFLPGCCLYTERLKTSSVLIIPKALRNTSVRTPLNHSDRAGIRPELSFRQALLLSCPPTCLLIQSLRPVPCQQGPQLWGSDDPHHGSTQSPQLQAPNSSCLYPQELPPWKLTVINEQQIHVVPRSYVYAHVLTHL